MALGIFSNEVTTIINLVNNIGDGGKLRKDLMEVRHSEATFVTIFSIDSVNNPISYTFTDLQTTVFDVKAAGCRALLCALGLENETYNVTANVIESLVEVITP